MKKTEKGPQLVVTFVLWGYPFTETSKEFIMSSEEEILAKAKSWNDCLGYTFRQKGKPKSTKKVLFGKPYTPEEIQALNTDGKYDNLLENIRINHYPRVIKTRHGFMPLNDDTEPLSLDEESKS